MNDHTLLQESQFQAIDSKLCTFFDTFLTNFDDPSAQTNWDMFIDKANELIVQIYSEQFLIHSQLILMTVLGKLTGTCSLIKLMNYCTYVFLAIPLLLARKLPGITLILSDFLIVKSACTVQLNCPKVFLVELHTKLVLMNIFKL